MEKEKCLYHGRTDCKACQALGFALKAEQFNKPNMVESQIAKAVAYEEAGE